MTSSQTPLLSMADGSARLRVRRGLLVKRAQAGRLPRRGGFTLIELLVVIAIMAGVLAMAAPRFLPVITFSTHQGAARRLANFGSAVIAEAALQRETLYVRVDLEHQEYWAERLPEPPEEEPLHAAMADDDSNLPEDDDELKQLAQEELDRRAEEEGTEEGQEVLEEQSTRMAEQSNLRARRALVARAARIKHDERALPQSVREKLDPSLASRAKQDEMEPEIVTTALIARTALPKGITFAWAQVAGVDAKDEVVTVEVGAAGLDAGAEFGLLNEDGDLFVVRWDPVSGLTEFFEETDK